MKALGKFLPVHYQKGITSNAVSGCPYHIGDFAQGGVIISLTHDGLHGLVAAIEDAKVGVNTTFKWDSGPPYTSNTATNNDSLPFSTPNAPYAQYYGGYKNQKVIEAIGNWQTTFPAFNAAAQYTKTVNGVTYDDWWLPSSTELSLMYAYRDVINQVSIANGGSALLNDPNTAAYWSSRQYEDDADNAWGLDFFSGGQGVEYKDADYAVRCVRAF